MIYTLSSSNDVHLQRPSSGHKGASACSQLLYRRRSYLHLCHAPRRQSRPCCFNILHAHAHAQHSFPALLIGPNPEDASKKVRQRVHNMPFGDVPSHPTKEGSPDDEASPGHKQPGPVLSGVLSCLKILLKITGWLPLALVGLPFFRIAVSAALGAVLFNIGVAGILYYFGRVTVWPSILDWYVASS